MQVITKPVDELVEMGDAEALALATMLDQAKEFVQQSENRQKLETSYIASEEAPELKVLPPHLKYSFLGGDIKKLVILSSLLTAEEEEQVIEKLLKLVQMEEKNMLINEFQFVD